MRCAKNASSIRTPGSKLQTRARIFEEGLQAGLASGEPADPTMETVEPGGGSPSTSAIAPEKTHGCSCLSDLSRPGRSRTRGTAGSGINSRQRTKAYPRRTSRPPRKRTEAACEHRKKGLHVR